jgi:hypothetical protein
MNMRIEMIMRIFSNTPIIFTVKICNSHFSSVLLYLFKWNMIPNVRLPHAMTCLHSKGNFIY